MRGFLSMTSFALATVLPGLGAPLLAQSSAEREFTTAAGRTLVLAPVDGMKCAEIDKMLARIDATRYRENAPTPHDAADAPLYEYETMLAQESYNRCVAARKKSGSGMMIMRSRAE